LRERIELRLVSEIDEASVGAVCDRAFYLKSSEIRAVIDRAYNIGCLKLQQQLPASSHLLR
jgi:hypothetical protein